MSNQHEDPPQFLAVKHATTDAQIKHLMTCLRFQNQKIKDYQLKLETMKLELQTEGLKFERALGGLDLAQQLVKEYRPMPGLKAKAAAPEKTSPWFYWACGVMSGAILTVFIGWLFA